MKVQSLAAESYSMISGATGAEHGPTRPLQVSPTEKKIEVV